MDPLEREREVMNGTDSDPELSDSDGSEVAVEPGLEVLTSLFGEHNPVIRRLEREHMKLKDKLRTTRERVKLSKDRRIQELKRLREEWERKNKEIVLDFIRKPSVIRFTEKLTYFGSVLLIAATAFVLGHHPPYIIPMYTFLIFFLLLWRFFQYRSQKFHYFMLDFCYLVNATLLFYIYYYPTSKTLFDIVNVNTSGPLILAIVAWRNSVVFDDNDRMTSVFIHSYPALVCYVIRWDPSLKEVYATHTYDDGSIHIYGPVVPAILYYLYWQVCYLVKTEIADRERLSNDAEIMTSFRWMTVKYKKILLMFGPKYALPWYTVLQLLYMLLCYIPALVCIHSQRIHICCLLFCNAFAVWNGATFHTDRVVWRDRIKLERTKKDDTNSDKSGTESSS